MVGYQFGGTINGHNVPCDVAIVFHIILVLRVHFIANPTNSFYSGKLGIIQ